MILKIRWSIFGICVIFELRTRIISDKLSPRVILLDYLSTQHKFCITNEVLLYRLVSEPIKDIHPGDQRIAGVYIEDHLIFQYL